jgi:hypothetical protein
MARRGSRSEGIGRRGRTKRGRRRRSNYYPWESPIEEKDIAYLLGRKYRGMLRHYKENAEIYANARARKGYDPKPTMILGPQGLVEQGFVWTWMPPGNDAFRIWSKRRGPRPWTFIFIHSFSYGIDLPYLRKHKAALHIPGDKWLHSPDRWFCGVNELTRVKDYTKRNKKGKKVNSKVSIHFCISRRGDVMTSVDLNDLAYHGGGTIRMLPRGGNNTWTIGLELEPALERTKPYGAVRLANYTDPQMLALAIMCKKINTIKPVAENVVSRLLPGSIRKQCLAAQSGYISHIDIHPSKKLDPRAQFDIMPGQETGTQVSGFTQLWNLMKKVRNFDDTELFAPEIVEPTFQVADLTAMMGKVNDAQKIALKSQRDRLLALRRASSMQTQTRRTLSRASLGQGATLHNKMAQNVSRVTTVVRRFSTTSDNVPTLTGQVQSYNEETGTWEVGGSDTGKAL